MFKHEQGQECICFHWGGPQPSMVTEYVITNYAEVVILYLTT